MSNRNIGIAAVAIIMIAGIAYTQQADSTETASNETVEVTTGENTQALETAPAANTADNANEISTTNNASEVTVEAPTPVEPE